MAFPRPFAIVMLNPEVRARLASAPQARGELEQSFRSHLEATNAQLDPHEQLAFMAVVSEQWTEASGFATPTLKVERMPVEQRYAPYFAAWGKAQQPIVWQGSWRASLPGGDLVPCQLRHPGGGKSPSAGPARAASAAARATRNWHRRHGDIGPASQVGEKCRRHGPHRVGTPVAVSGMLRLSLSIMLVTWVVAMVRLSLATRAATPAPLALEVSTTPDRLAA